MPVVVLVNSNSASASEITAGSLQDLDRAVIMGTRTFGKGLVQQTVDLPHDGSLKLTVSKYYIPSGRCIQAINYKHTGGGYREHIPDSLTREFKTKGGRIVRDGGGIKPDIEVKADSLPNIALYLAHGGLDSTEVVHYYVIDYLKAHPTIAPAGQFEITDEIYNDFVNYLSDKTYDYTTYTENIINDLRKVAEEENYMDNLKQQIDQLEKTYKDAKKEDLMRNRTEISQLLKDAILLHYYYRKGCIEGALADDPDVKKAVEILTNPTEYNRILNK
jgi:carboxyl-terminal processing protease